MWPAPCPAPQVAVKSWEPQTMVEAHALMGEASVPLENLEPEDPDERLWPLFVAAPRSVAVKARAPQPWLHPPRAQRCPRAWRISAAEIRRPQQPRG